MIRGNYFVQRRVFLDMTLILPFLTIMIALLSLTIWDNSISAQKIINIRSELDRASTYEQVVLPDMPLVSLNSDQIFQEFSPMSDDDTKRLITSSNKKSSLLDSIPTKLVIECLDVLLSVITKMINLSLESGIFPCAWKEADVQPRLKKQALEVTFENLRPISNLPYVSKLVERTVCNQSHNHLSVHHLYPIGISRIS